MTKRRVDSARIRQGETDIPIRIPRKRLVLLRSIAYAVNRGEFSRAQELERELSAYDISLMTESIIQEGIRSEVFQDAMG